MGRRVASDVPLLTHIPAPSGNIQTSRVGIHMPDHPTFPRVVRPGEGDPRLRVRAGMQTDAGVERKRNEDSAAVDDGGRFAVLADGMGGAGAGEIASAIAVD